MIRGVTGISSIRMLYVQLMYRCNFSCQHCFHGELLKAKECYTAAEVESLLRYFRRHYGLEAVTFLGGEPLLYPDIVGVCRSANNLGLGVELCSNGHAGFIHRINQLAPYLARLRISLEGLEATNDRIRQQGSFASAIKTITAARLLGIALGATMTVTATNIGEVVPLARILEQHGVQEVKLHCLRPVGNAVEHPELFVLDARRYARLHEEIAAANLQIALRYDSDLSDSDLSPQSPSEACFTAGRVDGHVDRIEIDPRGALTMSCKAVGRHAHAFQWDKAEQTIDYQPHAGDELARHISDVVYRTT